VQRAPQRLPQNSKRLCLRANMFGYRFKDTKLIELDKRRKAKRCEP
jgi:hypothetical protein